MLIFSITENAARCKPGGRLLSDRFCVFRGGDAKFLLKLAGKMMDRGILEGRSNLCEVQIIFTDHLLTLLELDPADVLTGEICRFLWNSAVR